jgi:hypothetical protein
MESNINQKTANFIVTDAGTSDLTTMKTLNSGSSLNTDCGIITGYFPNN